MSGPRRREVPVRLGERSYVVRIGPGLLGDSGPLLATLAHDAAVVLVTNATVRALYCDAVLAALNAAGARAPLVVEIPDGETFKSLATVERIYDQALDHAIDRSAIVVALGGGIVGDVAGFAAATLLRGLRLVMVPTTLLAQIDSSVGGKTGVNRPHGKNLVGAFHQPSLVLSDTETFATLPAREYKAGLAEVVKTALIFDEELFVLLETRSDDVMRRDADLMTDVVTRCVELKAAVVERDEREGGLRRVLNFGHTIGHAIEQATGYSRYLHGEAVAIGMVAAVRVSCALGACDAAVLDRLAGLLTVFGLDHAMPADVSADQLERAIAVDKKVSEGKVWFIVCEGVGSCRQQQLATEQMRAGFVA